jgi:hypothetical protein
MTKEENQFKKLQDINVDQYREKKGRFDYLSWAIALRELKKIYPTATFEVIKYDNKPYCKTETGYFVEVAVTVNDVTQSQIHPVLDNANRPIAKPNCFQINTSIQRCLAKAIALHGLGLSLFAGEDLEQYDEKKPATKPATQNTQNKDYSKSVTVEQQPNDDYWGDAVIPEPNFDFDDNSKPKTEENKDKKNNVQNPATEKQLALLRKKGVISDTDIVTKQEASVLIGNMFK